MGKREMLVSIVGIIVIIIVVIMYNSNNDMTFSENDIMYAVNVDGTPQNNFPAKGLYLVNLSCENARGKWDYDNWKLYVDNITGAVSCDITFTTINKTYLNNKIISLSGTTQGTGQVVNENGYRYEGKNPNNYIWFNNELWRIIGVFDSTSHGQSGQNLVKIIREGSLGGLTWDKSGKNNWSTSSLKRLLNPISGDSASGAYYNKKDGTNSGYCYGFVTTVGTNCDYSEKGINVTYRPMIKNVTWYLGGISTTSGDENHYRSSVDKYYQYERDATKKYSSNPASDTGYIGLMYVSDYGYSVLASSCARTTTLNSYGTNDCAGQSWLYGNEGDRTITPRSNNSSNAFNVSSGGGVGSDSVNTSRVIRPTLYLDSSVYVLDGDGSLLDPYIIAM